MEAALVSAFTGVMRPLLSKLTKLLGDKYVKLKGVRKQIKFLIDELSSMAATLQMLGDAEELNPVMKDWRDKLRELGYDIEDCIDSFIARVDLDHDHDDAPALFLKLKKLIARHEIANEIKELKARAIEASNRHKRYNFSFADHSPSSSSSVSAVDPRLAALYEDVDRLVGIDDPKKQVIEWITTNTMELRVLPIVGCGGLGKTTLANQVYHSIKTKLGSRSAFVSVSRNPNLRKVLRDIAQEMRITVNLDDDERQLIDQLRHHLCNKRYFVVIDDVWDVKTWEIIKHAFPCNISSSRIIVTTRSIRVASHCSYPGSYVYEMKPLGFNDSKRLFSKRAFGTDNSHYPHLEDVLDDILGKCGGLPLSIITIASLLANQHTKAQWDRVLNAIGSSLARDPNAENMAKILSLSFLDLPHQLKTCLLYLSVLPGNYLIEKQCLINRWIAEGFIHEEKGQIVYEIGECYFNDLINRNIIQPVNVKHGQAKACRVHDIILDYIKCKAAEVNFVTPLDASEHGYTSEYKVRRLCVNDNNKVDVDKWEGLNMSQVRSFTISGHLAQTSLSAFTTLRVLDLVNCGGMKDHHLAGIEKLFYLKYLRLSSYSITRLPEKIGALKYLQTLDVRGSSIKELPPSIADLQRLVNLYVDWTTTFPNGVIGQMHGLEELFQYGVQSYEERKSLQEFSTLTKLRILKIRWNYHWSSDTEKINQAEELLSYVGPLLSLCNLHSLCIVDCSGNGWHYPLSLGSSGVPWHYPLSLDSWNLTAPCNLQKLQIKNCVVNKVPNWIGLLQNLEVLELQISCVRPEDINTLGAIPSLLFLEIGTMGGTDGNIIIHNNNGFTNLKYFSLSIHDFGTSLDFEPGSLPKVEHLKLGLLVKKMECLNGASNLGIQHLSTLSKVEVKIIRSNRNKDSNLYLAENMKLAENLNDSASKYVVSAIKTAVETLPNRPTIRFHIEDDYRYCKHCKFKFVPWERLEATNGVSGLWMRAGPSTSAHHDPATRCEDSSSSRSLQASISCLRFPARLCRIGRRRRSPLPLRIPQPQREEEDPAT